MPVEFTILAVAFFDTRWSPEDCRKFYLFEPICTAFLLGAVSAVHVIRITAIYDKNRTILISLSALFAFQIVVTAICCAFYRSVPLLDGQGCIAGPKSNWVGIYWVAPTLLYTVTLILAVLRSYKSLEIRPLGLWKLMLRDGLNLYAAVWLVNMVNMFFWFIMTPTGPDDPIKTIVTSMAAVLSTSMTLRIVLTVRGSLAEGGSFLGHSSASTSLTNSSRTAHALTSNHSVGVVTNLSRIPPTYTIDNMRSKVEQEWTDSKVAVLPLETQASTKEGVKISIDREIDYGNSPYPRRG